MKALLIASFFTLSSNSAVAAFLDSSLPAPISTVEQAKKAADDTEIQLTGYIVQALGNETYLFQDSTGQITVEIENENWLGQDVSPQDKVIIRGEVESEWFDLQIEVDAIRKL